MGAQGSTSVSFGSGALEATATVVGQGALTGANLVEAWALANETIGATNDDSAWADQIQVYAIKIVAGTGFTVIAKPAVGKGFGTYNIGWVWN